MFLVGDFTRWKDHGTYRKGLERLLRDIKVEACSAHLLPDNRDLWQAGLSPDQREPASGCRPRRRRPWSQRCCPARC